MLEDLKSAAMQFQAQVASNLDSLVAEYRERFGKSINTDNARELCPEYAATPDNRSLLAPLIHEASSTIAKQVWVELLAENANQGGLVIFLAGGPGSGKSTIARSPAFQQKFSEAIVVYDSTFATFSSANSKIQQALKAGFDVDIFYIHRQAEDAAFSVVCRAVDHGRTVPIGEIAQIHFGAQQTILQLCIDYAVSAEVTVLLLDNSGEAGTAQTMDESDLRGIAYSGMMDVQRLVEEGAQKAYDSITQEQGSFPSAVYRGIFG
jgi:predicted ABC-type ATPase